jgi:hypothetical protein
VTLCVCFVGGVGFRSFSFGCRPVSGSAFSYYRSVWKLRCTFLFPVLGQNLAELDPVTPSSGSGLENGAECDQNFASEPNYNLSFAYSVILNLSFSYGPQNCHEMTSEFVHGADFVGVLQHLLSPTRLKGSWGQLWPKSGPKTKTKICGRRSRGLCRGSPGLRTGRRG